MYKVIFDMVYRYTSEGTLQLVGHLNGLTIEQFLVVNKGAFIL